MKGKDLWFLFCFFLVFAYSFVFFCLVLYICFLVFFVVDYVFVSQRSSDSIGKVAVFQPFFLFGYTPFFFSFLPLTMSLSLRGVEMALGKWSYISFVFSSFVFFVVDYVFVSKKG